MKLVKPIKWHGGKHYLAPKIVAMMPRHLHYVEPYGGGLSVLLERDPQDPTKWWGERSYEQGVSEVVADIHGDLQNFWRVLQDAEHFAEFHRTVQATPFSQEEWQRAADPIDPSPVGRAVAFFIRARQSRAGKMEGFATLTRNRTRRGMNEQASAWLNVVEGLPAVHARLKGVVILNDDALKVIRQQDGPKTCFYLDPPYLHETRASTGDYRYEMADRDHRDLLDVLAGIKGRFMLSGYDNPMYADYMARHGWRVATYDLPNNAAAGKTKQRKTECVWMNY